MSWYENYHDIANFSPAPTGVNRHRAAKIPQ